MELLGQRNMRFKLINITKFPWKKFIPVVYKSANIPLHPRQYWVLSSRVIIVELVKRFCLTLFCQSSEVCCFTLCFFHYDEVEHLFMIIGHFFFFCELLLCNLCSFLKFSILCSEWYKLSLYKDRLCRVCSKYIFFF